MPPPITAHAQQQITSPSPCLHSNSRIILDNKHDKIPVRTKQFTTASILQSQQQKANHRTSIKPFLVLTAVHHNHHQFFIANPISSHGIPAIPKHTSNHDNSIEPVLDFTPHPQTQQLFAAQSHLLTVPLTSNQNHGSLASSRHPYHHHRELSRPSLSLRSNETT
jgi:hypothetical protein